MRVRRRDVRVRRRTQVELGRVVEMDLEELVGWEGNPRRISDGALEGLKGSLRRWGLVQPVTWNERTGRVVGGHQRLKAMRELGHSGKVPVVVVDLPEEEEIALNVSLNNPAIQGEWDEQGMEDIMALLGEEISAEELEEVGLDELLGDGVGDGDDGWKLEGWDEEEGGSGVVKGDRTRIVVECEPENAEEVKRAIVEWIGRGDWSGVEVK